MKGNKFNLNGTVILWMRFLQTNRNMLVLSLINEIKHIRNCDQTCNIRATNDCDLVN